MAEAEERETNVTTSDAVGRCLADLLPALQRLDRLLTHAVQVAESHYGPEAARDSYRGLYIDRAQAEQLLRREPGAPLLYVAQDGDEPADAQALSSPSRLRWLSDAYALEPFEIDVLLIALAPEFDLRYGKLYAYLQDDVTRKRPSVDLVLDLLCADAAEKLERRIHFATDATLFKNHLLQALSEDGDVPLLGRSLEPDGQITGWLLGQDTLDERLASFCRWRWTTGSLEDVPLSAERKQELLARTTRARRIRRPLRLYFRGPKGAGKRGTAELLAGVLGLPLLVADLARALDAKGDFKTLLQLALREVWLQDAILYLDNLDVIAGAEHALARTDLLATLVQNDAMLVILGGEAPWRADVKNPLGMTSLGFDYPDFVVRQSCWRSHLAMAQIDLRDDELALLAGRFRLLPGQITEATLLALRQADSFRAASADSEGNPEGVPALGDLMRAARAQCGQDLAKLAQKVEPVYELRDIVLPDGVHALLQELCQRVTHGHRVLADWGFGQRLSLGKGTNALFSGPSGTGKTMAAEGIANELGLDLYKIDLSGIVSKYIGETEKNLNRIFAAAENANAILFFDEADALFGKRSEVRDSHDRYANIEISYLLQKMEEYEGIAILATNLRRNLDEAFTRRLAFSVHFPFPEADDRRRIWAGIWPSDTPLDEDLDLEFLANRFKLSGGNIKNIALASAFFAAADDDEAVRMRHVVRGLHREFQKMGKQLSAEELKPYAQHMEAQAAT